MEDESRKLGSSGKGLAFKIKSFFAQEYFKNHIIIWLLILGFVSNLVNWIILKIFVKPVDYPIILHYNVYFGVDVTGNWKNVWILPMIGVIVFLTNFLLSIYFYKNEERIAGYLLLMATLMVQLSLVVASTSVILINY